jgi:hypothetical protein
MFGRCAIVSVGGLMCTVSFLPRPEGFYLAMNRDEKRDRLAALIPAVVEIESRRAVFPCEPTGGTWISVNDAGFCLALINWHRIQNKPKNDTLSRGLVVRELAGKSSTNEIATSVKELPLRKLRPFRLIVIAPDQMRVTEWRWNLHRLTRRNYGWTPQHWFSSGFDEHRAERVRAKVCASFVAGGDDPGKGEISRCRRRDTVNAAGYSLNTLRQLHRSHAPKRGPFSICMHRADGATVSYTEVSVTEKSASMRYAGGPPCLARCTVAKMLRIA